MKPILLAFSLIFFHLTVNANNERICVKTAGGDICSASDSRIQNLNPCTTVHFEVKYDIPLNFQQVSSFEWFVNNVLVKTSTNPNDPYLQHALAAADGSTIVCKIRYRDAINNVSQVYSSPGFLIINKILAIQINGPNNPTTNCQDPLLYNVSTYNNPFLYTPAPSAYTVTWTPPSNWSQTSISPDGHSVNLIPSYDGGGTLYANVTLSSCGFTQQISHSIGRSSLPKPVILRSYGTNCREMTVSASIQGAQCYEWVVTGDLKINGTVTTITCTSASVQISSEFGSGGTIAVRGKIGNCYTDYTYESFCPCQPWPNANFTWIYSAPATGEPLEAIVDEPMGGAIYYDWFVNGQWIERTYTPFLYTNRWPCVYEGEGLSVIAITSCGTTETVYGGVYFPICYSYKQASDLAVKVYPNHAVSQITVEISGRPDGKDKKVAAENKLDEIRMIRIYDKMGQIKKESRYGPNMKKVATSISELRSDIYFIEVSDNNRKVRLMFKKD